MNISTRVISMLSLARDIMAGPSLPVTHQTPLESQQDQVLDSLRGEMRSAVLKSLSVGLGKGLVITSTDDVMKALTQSVYSHDCYNGFDTDVTTLSSEMDFKMASRFSGHPRIHFLLLSSALAACEKEYGWIFIDPTVQLPIWNESSTRDFIELVKPMLQEGGSLVIPVASPLEVSGILHKFEMDKRELPLSLSLQIAAVEPGKQGVPPKCVLSFNGGSYIKDNLYDMAWLSHFGSNCGLTTAVGSLREYLWSLKERLDIQFLATKFDSPLNEYIRFPYFRIFEAIVTKVQPIDFFYELLFRCEPVVYTSVQSLSVPAEVFKVSNPKTLRASLGLIPVLKYNEFVISPVTNDPIVKSCYFPPGYMGEESAAIFLTLPSGEALRLFVPSRYPKPLIWFSRMAKSPSKDGLLLYVLDVVSPSERTVTYLDRMRALMQINKDFRLGLMFERVYTVSEMDGVTALLERENWDGLRLQLLHGEMLSEFYDIPKESNGNCESIVVWKSRFIHVYPTDPFVSKMTFEDSKPVEPLPDVVVRYDFSKNALVKFGGDTCYGSDTQYPASSSDDIKLALNAPDPFAFLNALEPASWDHWCNLSEEDMDAFLQQNAHGRALKSLKETYPYALVLPRPNPMALSRYYFLRRIAWEAFSEPLSIMSL